MGIFPLVNWCRQYLYPELLGRQMKDCKQYIGHIMYSVVVNNFKSFYLPWIFRALSASRNRLSPIKDYKKSHRNLRTKSQTELLISHGKVSRDWNAFSDGHSHFFSAFLCSGLSPFLFLLFSFLSLLLVNKAIPIFLGSNCDWPNHFLNQAA